MFRFQIYWLNLWQCLNIQSKIVQFHTFHLSKGWSNILHQWNTSRKFVTLLTFQLLILALKWKQFLNICEMSVALLVFRFSIHFQSKLVSQNNQLISTILLVSQYSNPSRFVLGTFAFAVLNAQLISVNWEISISHKYIEVSFNNCINSALSFGLYFFSTMLRYWC